MADFDMIEEVLGFRGTTSFCKDLCESLVPQMEIIHQPKESIRFRYASEISGNANSRIVAVGSKDNTKDNFIFPTISVANCPYQVRIIVSLATDECHRHLPHLYQLYHAKGKVMRDQTPSPFSFHDGNCIYTSEHDGHGNHLIIFDCLGVLVMTNADVKNEIREQVKRSFLFQREDQISLSEKIDDNSFSEEEIKKIEAQVVTKFKELDNDTLSLRFDARILLPDGGEDWSAIQPVFSNPIRNSKTKKGAQLEVITYAPTKSPIAGEIDIVVVFKNKMDTTALSVRFTNETGTWSKEPVISKLHQGVALIMKIPECESKSLETEKFFIDISRKDLKQSVRLNFCYVPDEVESRKRKLEQDVSPNCEDESKKSKLALRKFLMRRKPASPAPSHDSGTGSMCGDSDDTETDAMVIPSRPIVDPVSCPTVREESEEMLITDARPTAVAASEAIIDAAEAEVKQESQEDTQKEPLPVETSEETQEPVKSVAASQSVQIRDQTFIDSFTKKSMAYVFRLPHRIAFAITDDKILDDFLDTVPHLLTVTDQYGDTPLHNAILKNQQAAAFRILNHLKRYGPKTLNKQNSSGHTPLMITPYCEEISFKFVDDLLDSGAQLDIPDEKNNNPFHFAVRNNRVDLVKIFIRYAKQRNQLALLDDLDCDNQAPLHYAVLQDSCQLVELLIHAGADVNITTPGNNSQTPLHLACLFKREIAGIRLLKSSDVDVNTRLTDGRSALNIAIQSGAGRLEAVIRDKGGVNHPANDDFDDDSDEGCDVTADHDELEVESDGVFVGAGAPAPGLLFHNNISCQFHMREAFTTVDAVIKELYRRLSDNQFFRLGELILGKHNRFVSMIRFAAPDSRVNVFKDLVKDHFTIDYVRRELPRHLRDLDCCDIIQDLFVPVENFH